MVGQNMSPFVPPVGASALMPPASQGVEQRSECHASRTGSRWVVRAFVIGGLAGAAWLLSGAAAQAADHTSAGPAIGGPSILSPVHRALPGAGEPFVTGPLVNGLGNGAVERTVHTAGRTVNAVHRTGGRAGRTGSVTDVVPPNGVTRQLTSIVVRPAYELATTVDEAVRTTGDTAFGGVVRELTAPLRPAGEPVVSTLLSPVTGIVAPATAPLVQTLRPATVLPHHAAVPAPVASRPATAAAADGHTSVTGPARSPGVPAAVKLPAVDPTGRLTADSGPRTMGGSTMDTQRRFAVADRHTAATTARPDGVRNTPGSPEPAPLRVHLGAVSGIATSGSGAPSEGGCAATLPAAVAASTVACHLLPIATDVEVRRYDAESPTVSPD
jgi:hypothetical protein